jgi:hypothetical protein
MAASGRKRLFASLTPESFFLRSFGNVTLPLILAQSGPFVSGFTELRTPLIWSQLLLLHLLTLKNIPSLAF